MNLKNDLIDTQWNVNAKKTASNRRGRIDLIDTQWNVNGNDRG